MTAKDKDPGEMAALLAAAKLGSPDMQRDQSTFVLHDDTHTLTYGSGSNRSESRDDVKSHRHQLSSWTWTRLSGSERKRSKKKKYSKIATRLFIKVCYLLALLYTLLILVGPLVLSFQDESHWCTPEDERESWSEEESIFNTEKSVQERDYDNPDYLTDPCRYQRLPQLVWLTLEECDMSRRMLTSVVLGGAIGYERRSSDRPAGIRTMGLVSLGACFFTISSIMAFKSSTMGWDASRVTAALPSGVGFLGAALIWKGKIGVGEQEAHQVHGLTTAASLWLSAAIGVGAGGALYVVSIYSTVLILLVLRFGPKFYLQPDYESDDEDDGEEEEKGEYDAPPYEVEADQKSVRGENSVAFALDYGEDGQRIGFSDRSLSSHPGLLSDRSLASQRDAQSERFSPGEHPLTTPDWSSLPTVPSGDAEVEPSPTWADFRPSMPPPERIRRRAKSTSAHRPTFHG